MPSFSQKSLEKLNTCDPRLQKVFNEVIKHYDCTILEGHRDEATQNEYYRTGKSKLQWPNGEHNKIPSKAVDAAPFIQGKGIDWKNSSNFYLFAGFVLGVASTMGINLRCGADWNGNRDTSDQTFNDLVHFELKD